MAAIVRVKRHFQDDPLEALILNTKRQKLDKDEDPNISNQNSQIFTFTGTVKKEESPFTHITSTNENKFEQLKHHHTNILEKIRNQTKDESKNSRLKIIDSFRTLDDRQVDDKTEKNYTLIEVESSPTDHKDVKDENHEDYVYDIYYAKSPDIDDFCFDNLESIEPLEELVGHLPLDPEEAYETESDENDENNWRNDYPDSDVDEDDILNGIVGCRLDDDDDDAREPELSTSDEDVYDGYNNMALKYGKRYAQFKAREKESDDDDDDENDFSDNDCCGIDRDFICDDTD